MTLGQTLPGSLRAKLLLSHQQKQQPRLTRPKGVFEKKRWLETDDDDTLTLGSSGSNSSNSTNSERLTTVLSSTDPVAAGSCTSPLDFATKLTDAVRQLQYYQCEKEMHEVKKEIVDSVIGLFRGDQPMTYGEHVSELRQKAAFMGRVRVGPKKRKVMVGDHTVKVVNENCVTTSNQGPGHKDRQEFYECVYETSRDDAPNSASKQQGDNNDPKRDGPSSPSKDPHEHGKVLVKARWINNYHKYNEVKKKEQLEKFHRRKEHHPHQQQEHHQHQHQQHNNSSSSKKVRDNDNDDDDEKRENRERHHGQKRPIKDEAPQSCFLDRPDKYARRPGKYGEGAVARPVPPRTISSSKQSSSKQSSKAKSSSSKQQQHQQQQEQQREQQKEQEQEQEQRGHHNNKETRANNNRPALEHYVKLAKPIDLSPSITDDITKRLQDLLNNFQPFHP